MAAMIDRKIKVTFIRKLILRNNWLNIDLIPKIESPILFLTGSCFSLEKRIINKVLPIR